MLKFTFNDWGNPWKYVRVTVGGIRIEISSTAMSRKLFALPARS
jgi:hypothetical protein